MKRKYSIIVFVFLVLLAFSFFSNGFLKFLFNEKIWVHRVNSIVKLTELKNDYSGVELDVVFIDSLKQFDVNHPPAQSIHLTLEKYLSTVEQNKSLHFWLDFKNLTHQNQAEALKTLNSICEKYSFPKNNFIIESSAVSLLKPFLTNGYHISYYLHWPGLYTLNKIEFEQKLNAIKNELKTLEYTGFLSSDYRDYHILTKYFPNNKILLWIDNSFEKSNQFKDRYHLYKMLSDTQVNVILMKQKSKTNER